MKTLKNIVVRSLLFLLMALGITPAFAQNPNEIEMADKLRADGKIYVVVAVLTVMLIGLLIFLFMIDRKIGRLERQTGIK
ncbi:CcmD family protein [Adhaeribacter terreus]|uniref:CcmD family protein n=1 Tax=Adhaeribacter terreus TaxID=529703 RepID=A0ABW0E817_9BACT